MATGNVLTDTVATYTGNAWNVAATGTDPEADQSTKMTHHGWNNSRTAFNDLNAFFNGTKSAGIAGSDPTLLGGLTVTQELKLAGSTLSGYHVGADDIGVGNGTGDVGMTFEMGAGNTARICFDNGTNTEDGQIRYTGAAGSENMIFRARNADRVVLSNQFLYPSVGDTITLGGTSNGYKAIYLHDGTSAPSTGGSAAVIYVDSSDGDLKVKFADSTVKTIATDT